MTLQTPGFNSLIVLDARAFWDRGDGYDANDPNAPDVWRCGGCDTTREQEVCHCPKCGGLTASYLDRKGEA